MQTLEERLPDAPPELRQAIEERPDDIGFREERRLSP